MFKKDCVSPNPDGYFSYPTSRLYIFYPEALSHVMAKTALVSLKQLTDSVDITFFM